MSDPVTPERGDADPAAAMTLSEEQLVIDTELAESGRVRLTKRVQVETVTRTFELRREVLEVERLPAGSEASAEAAAEPVQTGALAPGSFQEGAVEIVLMQEEALITTEMVPRERVRLTKRILTEERAVEADLTSERADVEQRPPATE